MRRSCCWCCAACRRLSFKSASGDLDCDGFTGDAQIDTVSGDITLTEEFIRRTRDVGVPYRPSLPTPAGAARDGFVRTMTAAGLL